MSGWAGASLFVVCEEDSGGKVVSRDGCSHAGD